MVMGYLHGVKGAGKGKRRDNDVTIYNLQGFSLEQLQARLTPPRNYTLISDEWVCDHLALT